MDPRGQTGQQPRFQKVCLSDCHYHGGDAGIDLGAEGGVALPRAAADSIHLGHMPREPNTPESKQSTLRTLSHIRDP